MEPLPMNTPLKGILTIRKGLIEQRLCGGPTRVLRFLASEGFGVLRAKMLVLLNETEFAGLSVAEGCVYFRKSKGASQIRFEELTEDNFLLQLRHRWKRISVGDRSQWADDIAGNFEFEFFVYCARPATAIPTIHRATASRIRVTEEAVRQFEVSSGANLGPTTRQHVVTTHARQQDGTAVSVAPDATTQQAIALDIAVASVGTAPPRKATIRLEVNGVWVTYKVDVASLRAALQKSNVACLLKMEA